VAGINRTSVVGVLGDLSESRILDIQYALEVLGATVVPLGITIEQIISLLELSGADTLIGSAEELMQLIIQTQIRARDIVDYPLKKVLSLNESIQNPMHRHFEERMQVKIHDLFSSEELGFAGLLYECGAGKGAHLQEDNYYAEVVEFGNAQPITEDGKMGELVLTTLQVQAMPLLRYRTGQAVMRLAEPCACGRTFMRFITPFGGI
jgi:phenylacetate-CoA ligase